MMKVTITRDTVAAKKPVFVGEIHDLDDTEARYLVQIGKAEAVKPQPVGKAGGLTTRTAAATVKQAKKK